MNSKQLRKINELVEQVKNVNNFLIGNYPLCDIGYHNCQPMFTLSREYADPIIKSYRDRLIAELKELGYEE